MKKKIKITLQLPKPRNPLIKAMIGKKAGSHTKPFKSERKARSNKKLEDLLNE